MRAFLPKLPIGLAPPHLTHEFAARLSPVDSKNSANLDNQEAR